MTFDLPPMVPCPVGPEGRHALIGWAMTTDEQPDLATETWTCKWCGAMRRVPAYGAMVTGSLDGLSAESIAGIVGTWETR